MKMGKGLAWISAGVAGAMIGLLVFSEREEGPGGQGADLIVYCAAGIKPPIVELAEKYQQEYGVSIRLQYGGSGTLLSNLQVSRQGDLYIAADASYQELAKQKGLVREILPLASMRPVIAVKQGNPKGIHTVADLLRKDVRVALGNPDAASIGKQTRSILQSVGQWDALQRHVEDSGVFKPTVPEVANDVKIGAVDAGVIWDATANQYAGIEAVHVEVFDAAPRQIAVGVVASAVDPTRALRFARYLNSTVGNEVFRKNRYEPVDGDDWEWHPELTFFCGAVNRRAVDEVIHEFEVREGVTVNTVYNGCGILTAQMRTIRQDEGAAGFPDTYMACDRYYLENVRDWFQEDVDISDADIVIAVPKGNPRGITGLADLGAPGMRVAVGQPQQCTIGALTRIMLEKEGVKDVVMSNVVMQTASSAMLVPSVTTRSVDAALAYITDTKAEENRIDVVRIDSAFAKAIQPFSIAKSSKHKYLGRRLFEAVAAARDRFEAAGFHYRLGD